MNMQLEPGMTTVAELLGAQLSFEQNPVCVLWKMGAVRRLKAGKMEGFDIVTESNYFDFSGAAL